MRSFRSKPTGWRYESAKHALAARGISTKQKYYAGDGYDKAASFLKGMFSDGSPETIDYKKMMMEHSEADLRANVMARLDAEEQKGNISAENASRFMEEDFMNETKLYFGGGSKQQYHDNVMRMLERHLKIHDKQFHLFGDNKDASLVVASGGHTHVAVNNQPKKEEKVISW